MIAHRYVKVIEHEDKLRTRFTRYCNKDESAKRNTNLSFAKLAARETVANKNRSIGAL